MHSGKDKWDYYKKISGEVYKIINDNLDKPYHIIVKEIKVHLIIYNEKTSIYRLDILRENKELEFETGDFSFVMFEYVSIRKKKLFEKQFNLKGIIRKIKIDKLLE